MRVELAAVATLLLVAALVAQAPRESPPSPVVSNPPSASGASGRAAAPPGPPRDEFVGPFQSWSNLRTDFHAAGDGVADDSDAFQAALDRLGAEKQSPVLFVPAGTYRITHALSLNYQLGVSILGEDPAQTRIVWSGPSGGTMLFVRGVAYSRIGRLTFDGRGAAAVAVEQTWDNTHGSFDSGNEYADDQFLDVDYGIRGGFEGHGFAETSILRARFLRNRIAGVALGNFNALDIWIWHSLFEDCGTGVTNNPGAGNYHVYNSVFRRSKVADLSLQNTGGFSARDNYSIGSKAFWISDAAINHPATVDIQRNVILDPQSAVAIKMANQGPALLLDNRIRSLPNTGGPIVSWSTLFGSDVISIGNTFTVANAVSANGRLVTLDDRLVTRTAIDDAEPALPSVEPSRHRRVFDVPSGANAAAIQQAIDAAIRDGGARPIVHLPSGKYSIDRTLTVGTSDVQIVGDGYLRTVLQWTGSGRGPVLAVHGPSQATLRELQVDGAGTADGIVMTGVDRTGARAHLEGVQLRSGKESNLTVDGITQTAVQLVDFGHAYSPTGSSIRVAGTGTVPTPGTSPIVIYSGASSVNRRSYDLSRGASLIVRDVWYEGSAEAGFARVGDSSALTMDGSRVSSPRAFNPPAFVVDANAGRVALLLTHFDDRVQVEGNTGRASVLALAGMREENTIPVFTNAPAAPARALLVNLRQRVSPSGLIPRGTVPVADIGTMDGEFVRAMLRDTRSVKPPSLDPVPAGSSDLRLFRVWAANGANNIVLRATRPN